MTENSILDEYLELNSEKVKSRFKIEIRNFLNGNGGITLKDIALSSDLSASKLDGVNDIFQYIVRLASYVRTISSRDNT